MKLYLDHEIFSESHSEWVFSKHYLLIYLQIVSSLQDFRAAAARRQVPKTAGIPPDRRNGDFLHYKAT